MARPAANPFIKIKRLAASISKSLALINAIIAKSEVVKEVKVSKKETKKAAKKVSKKRAK